MKGNFACRRASTIALLSILAAKIVKRYLMPSRSNLVMHDGRMGLIWPVLVEIVNVSVGRLEIGTGEKHHLFKARAQITLGRDLGSGSGSHRADLFGGVGGARRMAGRAGRPEEAVCARSERKKLAERRERRRSLRIRRGLFFTVASIEREALNSSARQTKARPPQAGMSSRSGMVPPRAARRREASRSIRSLASFRSDERRFRSEASRPRFLSVNSRCHPYGDSTLLGSCRGFVKMLPDCFGGFAGDDGGE